MFGINGAEVLVLLLVAVIVVGPERLPVYAEQLGRWTRRLRTFAGTAKERVAAELGEEAADVDWASLDPRRYDPRRIVREALLDESVPGGAPTAHRRVPAGPRTGDVTGAAGAGAGAVAVGSAGAGRPTGAADAAPDAAPVPAPFDDEAT